MPHVIQADENGALLVPAGLVPPGTRFTVESRGGDVILRHEPPGATSKEATAAGKIAWLREWIASLPPSPPLPPEATHRDSMYD